MTLITCPTCHGSGYEGRRVCRECHGAARGVMLGNHFLYWGLALSDFDIKLRKLKSFLDDILNAFALAVSIGALLLFGYYIYQTHFSGFLSPKFWSSDLPAVKILWLGVLFILFIIYRLRTENVWRMNVLQRKYGEEVKTVQEVSWDDAKKIRKKNRRDASKSFQSETLKAVEASYVIARKWKHGEVGLLHLFAALLQTRSAQYVFIRIDPEKYKQVIDRVKRALGRETPSVGGPKVSDTFYEVLFHAYIDSYVSKENLVNILLLLSRAAKEDKRVVEILYDLGIDEAKFTNTVAWTHNNEKIRERIMRFRRSAALKPKGAMDRAMTALATPLLDRWSQDLTRLAAFGYLPSVVDREEQFDAVFRVIESGRGAILVGEAGVGKDTIIEGLAERMVEEDVPRALYDKRLVMLNIADLVSGVSPGEIGERFLAIFHDLRRGGNAVLYVPHIERLVGVSAGAGGEGNDLASLLANEVGRGYFICFASTDPEGYRTKIEGSSLHTVFERIDVPEPKADLAIQMIESATASIEAKNKVFFSYDAIERAVTLGDRYMHDRYLPDKALEILRETAVGVSKKRGANKFVSGEDVAVVVAEKTKIPVAAVTQEETEKLANLEKKMHERVVGQDEAVSAVARALRRARAELREAKRPIANFLFLGPTGVGKTETAKAVAVVYFGNEKQMIRLDMSEYQDKASMYKMIGAPTEKGGGFLTEAVRRAPFSLLLLDEIEKAHPDILNLFLQVMDDGRLTDNEGRTVDFTNVILIATSNAGTPFIQAEVGKGTSADTIKERLMREELKGVFRPEFLNRFDGIIVFKPLNRDEIEQITWLILAGFTKRLEEKGIAFQATDGAVRELAAAGFDPIFGARPLRRAIQERVEDAIAKLLLEKKLSRRDKIIYDVGGAVRVEKAKEL